MMTTMTKKHFMSLEKGVFVQNEFCVYEKNVPFYSFIYSRNTINRQLLVVLEEMHCKKNSTSERKWLNFAAE